MELPHGMEESKTTCPNSIHDATIDSVVDRLMDCGRYERVWRNVVYSRKGLNGEIDVFAKLYGLDLYHFYEIKSNDQGRLLNKARSQYGRFQLAYPSLETRGIIVVPDKENGTNYLHALRM